MKIAIPVINTDIQKTSIAASLSVLGSLCIYDTIKNEGRWMKTMDLAPNMGELLPALEKESVSTIITRQLQPMALKVLVNKGFEVFKADGNRLEDNILLYNLNELAHFDMEAAMQFATICGGECDDCKTDCETTPN
jgi:predicted Fe-Mo cluster-binding NifX family protein